MAKGKFLHPGNAKGVTLSNSDWLAWIARKMMKRFLKTNKHFSLSGRVTTCQDQFQNCYKRSLRNSFLKARHEKNGSYCFDLFRGPATWFLIAQISVLKRKKNRYNWENLLTCRSIRIQFKEQTKQNKLAKTSRSQQ